MILWNLEKTTIFHISTYHAVNASLVPNEFEKKGINI